MTYPPTVSSPDAPPRSTRSRRPRHPSSSSHLRRVLTPDFNKTCRRDALFSHHIAGFLVLLDARDEALGWLENAVDQGLINYPLLAEKDKFLDRIRGDRAFERLLKRVERKWRDFEL